MSAIDYTKLTVDELSRRFAEAAKVAGCVFTLSPEKIANPKHKHYIAEVQAIGTEIRNRNPCDQVHELFNHPDPDVRGLAGQQFHSLDPEWAFAAVNGVLYHLTTQEVLAWRRRILQRSSRSAVLGTLTIAQLVDCFVDACERCYGATRFLTDEEGGGPSMDAHNRVSGDIYAAAKELNRRGELQALLPLLKHPLITVRERAAAYCLPIATEAATAVLQQVHSSREFPEHSKAARTLDYCQKGEYCAFPEDPKKVRV